MLIKVQGRDSTGNLRYIAEHVRSGHRDIGTFSNESLVLLIMNAYARALMVRLASQKSVH